MRIVITHTRHG